MKNQSNQLNDTRAKLISEYPDSIPPMPSKNSKPVFINDEGTILDEMQAAIVNVGRWLKSQNYRFVTITPETQRRVNARSLGVAAENIREVFGWSRPFHASLLPVEILDQLKLAGCLHTEGNLLRSGVRFSNIENFLFAHSAFPTNAADCTFFGPDTMRFIGLIRQTIAGLHSKPCNIVDIGCGTGAGGYLAAAMSDDQRSHLQLVDINPHALKIAKANAVLNNFDSQIHKITYICGDILDSISGPLDFIIANPPYIADSQARLYRNGGTIGGAIGGALSIRIVVESLKRLSPGGCLLLYSGSAIVSGEDNLYKAILPHLKNVSFEYSEIDPDIFGEELDCSAYSSVERIAAICLLATMPYGAKK